MTIGCFFANVLADERIAMGWRLEVARYFGRRPPRLWTLVGLPRVSK